MLANNGPLWTSALPLEPPAMPPSTSTASNTLRSALGFGAVPSISRAAAGAGNPADFTPVPPPPPGTPQQQETMPVILHNPAAAVPSAMAAVPPITAIPHTASPRTAAMSATAATPATAAPPPAAVPPPTTAVPPTFAAPPMAAPTTGSPAAAIALPVQQAPPAGPPLGLPLAPLLSPETLLGYGQPALDITQLALMLKLSELAMTRETMDIAAFLAVQQQQQQQHQQQHSQQVQHLQMLGPAIELPAAHKQVEQQQLGLTQASVLPVSLQQPSLQAPLLMPSSLQQLPLQQSPLQQSPLQQSPLQQSPLQQSPLQQLQIQYPFSPAQSPFVVQSQLGAQQSPLSAQHQSPLGAQHSPMAVPPLAGLAQPVSPLQMQSPFVAHPVPPALASLPQPVQPLTHTPRRATGSPRKPRSMSASSVQQAMLVNAKPAFKTALLPSVSAAGPTSPAAAALHPRSARRTNSAPTVGRGRKKASEPPAVCAVVEAQSLRLLDPGAIDPASGNVVVRERFPFAKNYMPYPPMATPMAASPLVNFAAPSASSGHEPNGTDRAYVAHRRQRKVVAQDADASDAAQSASGKGGMPEIIGVPLREFLGTGEPSPEADAWPREGSTDRSPAARGRGRGRGRPRAPAAGRPRVNKRGAVTQQEAVHVAASPAAAPQALPARLGVPVAASPNRAQNWIEYTDFVGGKKNSRRI